MPVFWWVGLVPLLREGITLEGHLLSGKVRKGRFTGNAGVG